MLRARRFAPAPTRLHRARAASRAPPTARRPRPPPASAPDHTRRDRPLPPRTGAPRRCGSPPQLRNVLDEDLLHFAQLGPPLQSIAHVAQRGRNVRQERRVLLHLIDEDESPRVLQLALHGEQIEEADELLGRQRRPALL